MPQKVRKQRTRAAPESDSRERASSADSKGEAGAHGDERLPSTASSNEGSMLRDGPSAAATAREPTTATVSATRREIHVQEVRIEHWL